MYRVYVPLHHAVTQLPAPQVSYKPQKLAPRFDGRVSDYLQRHISEAVSHARFIADVLKPLRVDALMDMEVTHLSGGELQRLALVAALGTPADIYLIDEPSAYLDSEQRIATAQA